MEGYVVYRLKGDTVFVQQLMAITDAAYTALWAYCFGIDLRTTTKTIAPLTTHSSGCWSTQGN